MRKTFSLLFIFALINLQAQIGVKAGLTYNADKGLIESIDKGYKSKGEGSIGYHVGINKKFMLTGLFVEPEIWYVSYKNEYKLKGEESYDIQYKRIDVPVSIGTSILGLANIKAGPVFSYYFKDKLSLDDVADVKQKDLALGLQVGAGIELQKFSINLRYDFPIGKRETEFIQNKDLKFKTESTPTQLHLSIGYEL